MINSSGFLNECSNNEGLWVLGFDLHLICALGEATQRALEKRKRERERFGSLMTENLLLGHLLLQPLLVDEMRCFFSFLEKEMMNLSLVLKRQLFAAVVVDEILVVFSRDEDDGSEPQLIREVATLGASNSLNMSWPPLPVGSVLSILAVIILRRVGDLSDVLSLGLSISFLSWLDHLLNVADWQATRSNEVDAESDSGSTNRHIMYGEET